MEKWSYIWEIIMMEEWSYIWEIIMMEEWKRFLSNRKTAGGFAGSAERRLSFEL